MTKTWTKNYSETRKVLTTLRDDIFTGALTKEYNTIFIYWFKIRFIEQLYVDWLSNH